MLSHITAALSSVEASGGANILLQILIILVAAKVAAEVAERLSIPTVVGEIVAGIAVGPYALKLVSTNEVLGTLAEIGVILLLLEVGMHMDLRELSSVGRSAMSVAVVGVIVPFAGGFFVNRALGFDRNAALFVGAALTATSVGITARVFGDLRALATREARTVLGAAVADDVMGLIVLTVVVRFVTEGGSVSVWSVLGTIALAVVFLVVCTTVGVIAVPGLFAWIERKAKSSSTLLVLALAFTLAISQLAILAKLAPIIGAFVAGLSLGRTRSAARLQRELTPVGHLFIPVFFLQIGINVNVRAFLEPRVLGIAAAITAVAIVGKLIAGWAIIGGLTDRLLIGLGMIPRGEVGLIFASIGLREGVFDNDLYAAVLLMVLVTTLITPPLLGWRISANKRAGIGQPLDSDPNADAADHGRTVARTIMQTALIAARRSPTDDELDRLRTNDDALVIWGQQERDRFAQLLAQGNGSSWRLLDATRLLDRANPELAPFFERRRRDATLLDPASVHRFAVLERVNSLFAGVDVSLRVAERLLAVNSRQRVRLAAWLIDLVGSDADDLRSVRTALERLAGTTEDADAVATLLDDQELLRGMSLRADGNSHDSVLRVAVHLKTQDAAASLYALSIAINALEPWERLALDQLDELIEATLNSPLLSGSAITVIDRRRSEAIAMLRPGTPAIERIAIAPLSYILSEEPRFVATEVSLLDPLPAKNAYVVSIDSDSTDALRIVIAARDRPGLLAQTTAALETAAVDVLDAVIATWADGGALQVFRVQSNSVLSRSELRIELTRLLTQRTFETDALPIPDAVIRFDNSASPWHTTCDVRATDRRGLLHAVAVAVSAVGADVHAARVTTADDMAFDVFELSDRSGRKLDGATQVLLREHLTKGSSGTWQRHRLVRGRQFEKKRLGTRSKQS